MTDIICFHNPDEENGYMSNWYISPFTVDGVTFSSMEQYMMYQKARGDTGRVCRVHGFCRPREFL